MKQADDAIIMATNATTAVLNKKKMAATDDFFKFIGVHFFHVQFYIWRFIRIFNFLHQKNMFLVLLFHFAWQMRNFSAVVKAFITTLINFHVIKLDFLKAIYWFRGIRVNTLSLLLHISVGFHCKCCSNAGNEGGIVL